MKSQSCLYLFLAGTLLLCGCGGNPGQARRSPHPGSPSAETTPDRKIPVRTESVQTGVIAETMETTGNLEAVHDIMLYPKISGQVREIRVDEGASVRQGDVLAVLDDDELKLRLQREQVAMLQAREKLERSRQLYEASMLSEEAYQDARYGFENAEVAFHLAELNVEHTRIRAPISGTVVTRSVSIGDLVQLSTLLFRIVDESSMEVNIFPPEREVRRLRVGMLAELLPDSLPGSVFPAEINRINPAVDPRTGTVKVTLALEEPDPAAAPGMFVRVRILLNSKEEAVLVPKKAVLRENGTLYAFIRNEEGRAERRELQIGLEDAVHYEVLNGVQTGESLVIVGQHGLEDGQPVEEADTEEIAGEAA